MAPKDGSATLMILLLMIGITIMAMTALKSSIALYELALERMEYVRQKKAMEAVVLYGIATTRQAYHQAPEEHTYEFATWPPPHGTYQSMVTIVPQDKEWKVMAKLFQNGKVLDVVELVVKNENSLINKKGYV